MILFGGAAGTDVWVLTNANGLGSAPPSWVQILAIGSLPSPLTDWEKQVYDPACNVLIVYDSVAGVWTLSHANGLGGNPVWTQLNVPANGPSGRAGFTTVYNPTSNRMIVFGGFDGTTEFNNIWVLANANGLGGRPIGYRFRRVLPHYQRDVKVTPPATTRPTTRRFFIRSNRPHCSLMRAAHRPYGRITVLGSGFRVSG
jgi:hypothetical protein